MNAEYFKRWWREREILRQSRTWLKANPNSTLVMDAMYHLNHLAKSHRWNQDVIYTLKNGLVRWLYEQGYCTSLTAEKQVQECWACDGTGEDQYEYGETCQKCGGTGAYREHMLYRFVFKYQGKTYVWHQPERFVTWPIKFTDAELRRFNDCELVNTPPYAFDFRYYYITLVYWFLRFKKADVNGVAIKQAFRERTLWQAIRKTFHDMWWWGELEWLRCRTYPLRCRLSAILVNLKKLAHFLLHGEFPEDNDDYIPF